MLSTPYLLPVGRFASSGSASGDRDSFNFSYSAVCFLAVNVAGILSLKNKQDGETEESAG